MTALSKTNVTPFVIPSDQDAAFAKETGRLFAKHITQQHELKVRLAEDPEHVVILPRAIVGLVMDILTSMAKGDAIALIPMHAEMTTQQAADFLSVSRPFLVQLLNEGKIPHRKVGTHRRVMFEDLVNYKTQENKNRSAALEELTKISQDIGMEF